MQNIDLNNIELKCSFHILKVENSTVYLVDDDVGKSVTNDAENVVRFVLHHYPDHRIIYKDTYSIWSELCHDGKQFIGFGNFPNQRFA